MEGAMKSRAFTLLETLVALVILGIALISMVGWLARSAAIENRLDLHRVAIRELEAQHEALRAGCCLPGTDGLYTLSPITDISALGTPKITLEVKPQSKAGLYGLVFKLKYGIGQERFEKQVEALSWRP